MRIPPFPLPPRSQSAARSRHAGFSLVEVTLALGIVATVLVALMAFLPLGMNSIKEAKSNLIMSRIANEIVTEVQSASWGSERTGYTALYTAYDGKERTYDNEGTRLEGNDGQSDQVVYRARIAIPNKATFLPGQTGVSGEGRFLRRVTIKVAYAPTGKKVDFDTAATPLPYKVFITELTNLGRVRLKKVQ